MRILQKALTFDDVLLVPAHSQILPRDVSLATKLTRNITLKMPLLSAAMDTVTEGRLAIAMAQEGGIGIDLPAGKLSGPVFCPRSSAQQSWELVPGNASGADELVFCCLWKRGLCRHLWNCWNQHQHRSDIHRWHYLDPAGTPGEYMLEFNHIREWRVRCRSWRPGLFDQHRSDFGRWDRSYRERRHSSFDYRQLQGRF